MVRHELEQMLQQAQGWEARNRLLVQLGRKLPAWPESIARDAHRVTRCESQVWLCASVVDNALQIHAASDSALLRGWLLILQVLYQGCSCTEAQSFDLAQWLAQTGMQHSLSASRQQGVLAMQQHILAACA